MLLAGHIAVYDVIERCEIAGSSDSSIRNVTPADISRILAESQVKAIFTNGKTAGKLYRRYQGKQISLPMIELPSTSPANAACSTEQLIQIWTEGIISYL